jgi:type IV fimbrial biogenesis protein FimT
MHKTLLPARRLPPRGLTLIELMIALALIAILLALAAPSLQEAMMSIRITGHTNDLMGDLAVARSEAVKRNIPVVLCSSTDGQSCAAAASWNQGWIVFPDVDASGAQNGTAEAALKTRGALQGNPTLTLNCVGASNGSVTYKSTGMSTLPFSIFTLCDSRTTANAGRTITINTTGRVISAKGTCPITAACP